MSLLRPWKPLELKGSRPAFALLSQGNGIDKSVGSTALLAHAVMLPLRHEFQLKELVGALNTGSAD